MKVGIKIQQQINLTSLNYRPNVNRGTVSVKHSQMKQFTLIFGISVRFHRAVNRSVDHDLRSCLLLDESVEFDESGSSDPLKNM